MKQKRVICFQAFPTDIQYKKYKTSLVKKHGFEEKVNQQGKYLYKEIVSEEAWIIQHLLDSLEIKYRQYDSRYERSNTYRAAFLRANRRKTYRCSYCGKRIKVQQMEVDHLVPVAKAKISWLARMLLFLQGSKSVNDVNNLVPSCIGCNRSKTDHMGLWVLRGMIGKHRSFWICLDVVKITFISFLIYIFIRYVPIFELFPVQVLLS